MNILHDGLLDIATGRSRRELNWKNTQSTWSDLMARLNEPHRTAETYEEYRSAKKLRQDEIKDVGGFVGGYLVSGRRKPGSVAHRQILTLDIDEGTSDFWNDFQLLYASAAALYSTHKHSPETPRYRLLIPLDRPVFSDEYIAISRRIAGNLGIEAFDNTTFQPSRLMYWPSVSKDGVYVFEYQDGPWLVADEVLGTYRDWKDSSAWPVSVRNADVIQRAIKKQGDPLEKTGVIGAFCRAYSIGEAIAAFLTDAYDHCDVEGRFTYKEGSTSAGLVVYDDKYAYSHHGTDPISGKLCNAFDLVRLHRFGLKDEDAKEGAIVTSLPSYKAMLDLATKDPVVRRRLGAEQLEQARNDFNLPVLAGTTPGEQDQPAVEEVREPEDDSWLENLDRDKNGECKVTIDNIVVILENDPSLKGRLAFDEFEQRAIARKDLPWRRITHQTRYLIDRDIDNLTHYLERVYNISSSIKLETALGVIGERHNFHPVRDYLNSLQWDGEERLDSLLIDYTGAADTDYTRAITRKILAAAVARVFEPGVKFDYVLVLIGEQGEGKSQLLDRLGRQWFSDSFSTITGKEAFEQIQGVWLVEMGELAGLKKVEVETIKHFISKRVDRYRVAYGRLVQNFPRQCVFFATSNVRGFLRDQTGNRRFWPTDTRVQPPTKDTYNDLTASEIDQIWAEAVHCYRDGEALYLSPELEQQALEAQLDHVEQDERQGLVQQYLDTLLPTDWEDKSLFERRAYLQGDEIQAQGVVPRGRICVAEIWCEVMGGMQREMTSHNTRFIHDILRNLSGWKQTKWKSRFKHYGMQRVYEKSVAVGKILTATSGLKERKN